MRRIIFASLALPLLAAAAAYAQDGDSSALTERITRLERDVTFLQRQVYRGAAPSGDPNAPMPDAPVAANSVKVSELQEQIRELRGEIEQLQYQNKQLTDGEKKFETDVDYRLSALEKSGAAAAAAPAPAVAPAPAPTPVAAEPDENAKPAQYAPKEDANAPAAAPADTGNANDAYNAAFKQYNAKDYSGAAVNFDAFLHKYPSDPLAANAYFWLGESYYNQTDYTRAADSFRKGYQTSPDGQKAPDNLYKLGMSLAAIKRTNEACIVLGQVIDKYGDANPRTKEKASAARVSLQCK